MNFLTIGGGGVEGLRVRVAAASNRAVVRGSLRELSLELDRLSSPLLGRTTRGFTLRGEDLELGGRPALLLASPALALLALVLNPLLLRRTGLLGLLLSPLVLLPSLLYVMTMAPPRWWPPPFLRNKSEQEQEQEQEKGKKGTKGGGAAQRNNVATYRLALSGDDLCVPGTLCRAALRKAMEDLLRNSVLGVAVTAASAAIKVAAASEEGAKAGAASPSSPEEQATELLAALEAGGDSVSFELLSVGVAEGGRLTVHGAATFANSEGGRGGGGGGGGG